jgi:FkbM family methyltransferase
MRIYPLQRRLRDGCGLVEIHEHHVYLPALSTESLVIDAGAHRGDFSRELLARVPCQVVALEPNLDLPRDHTLPSNLEWRQVALAPRRGRGLLRVSRNPQSSSLRPDLVQSDELVREQAVDLTSLETLLEGRVRRQIDLLKLDIEGAEIPLLSEESENILRAVHQISVEFHSFFETPHEKDAIRRVSRRLRSLGFVRLHASAPAEHESDVLFINTNAIVLPPVTRAYLSVVEPTLTLLRRVGNTARSLRRRLLRPAGAR